MAAPGDISSSDDQPTARGLRPNQIVGTGRYVLRKLLGQGGMGIVWLARDERLREDVALKFLPQQLRLDITALDDLRQETLKSRKLAHPNIVRIHDLFEGKDEDPFISMEYVDGPTLSARRVQQPMRILDWEELSRWVRQLCEALEYAHNERVIHRDLKPGNLMLDSRHRIKLADFGIARVVTDSLSRTTMRPGTSGTLVYMSPQQLDGLPSNPTDDIYSVGATLYELMASKPPFHTGDISHQIRYVKPDLISQRLAQLGIANHVPPHAEEAVAACLAKDPGHRPQNARELCERFGLLEARPPSSKSRTPSAVNAAPPVSVKNRQLLSLGCALGIASLCLILGGIWFFTYRKSGHPVAELAANDKASARNSDTSQNVLKSANSGGDQTMPIFPSAATNFPGASNVVESSKTATRPTLAPAPILSQKYPKAHRGWTNSLGMQFAPLPGTELLMSIWETRMVDYDAFTSAPGYANDLKRKQPTSHLMLFHPVGNVSYRDATNFCDWLTKKERSSGIIATNQVYRLPTDLEWSRAVGLENETGATPKQRRDRVSRRYPWGETWPPPSLAGNFAGREVNDKRAFPVPYIALYEDPFKKTAPVGSFPANTNGFYDLAGNVWEWCWNEYDPPESEGVLRGGAWNSADNTELLSSHRSSLGINIRMEAVGFRCVLDTEKGVVPDRTARN